jgi:hypothetical protein
MRPLQRATIAIASGSIHTEFVGTQLLKGGEPQGHGHINASRTYYAVWIVCPAKCKSADTRSVLSREPHLNRGPT